MTRSLKRPHTVAPCYTRRAPALAPVLTLILSSVIAISGCATLGVGKSSTPKGYPEVSNTIVQACAAGGLLGVAKVWIDDVLRKKDKDTGDYIMGGAVGVFAGCTLGYVMDEKRNKFATKSEFYASEIENTRRINGELKTVNAHLSSRTRANNDALKTLRAQKKSAALDAAAAKQASNTARADLAWAKEQLNNAKSSLLTQQTVLSESGAELTGSSRSNLQQEVRQLERYVSTLEKEVGYMSNINDALVNL